MILLGLGFSHFVWKTEPKLVLISSWNNIKRHQIKHHHGRGYWFGAKLSIACEIQSENIFVKHLAKGRKLQTKHSCKWTGQFCLFGSDPLKYQLNVFHAYLSRSRPSYTKFSEAQKVCSAHRAVGLCGKHWFSSVLLVLRGHNQIVSSRSVSGYSLCYQRINIVSMYISQRRLWAKVEIL